MDKLTELQQKITDFQAKSAAKDEIKAFIALVIAFLKKSKGEFESLSSENLSKIQESISEIENQKTEMLSGVNSLTEKATKDFDKKLTEVKKLLAEIKAIDVRDGVDGKDADEEKIVEEVLSKIKLPEHTEFVLDEKGEQIVKEINDLPTDDDDLKIDASHIKNLPKSLGNGNSHAIVRSISLDELTDVIAENPSTGQVLMWNGANWVNDNAGGGGGGSGATLFKALTPDEDGTYPLLQGAIDGVNTLYTVPEGQYITGTLTVWLNGVVVDPGTGSDEWQETDPVTGTFTFNTAPQSSTNDSVYVEYNTTAGGGGGDAAGADTQVQFNDAGSLNGDSTFTFNKTTNVLTVEGLTLTGTLTLPDDIRQTFNPGATVAGLNVGSLAGDPSTPINGDLWYDSTANELTARINGANVALGSGGGGSGITIGTTTITSGTNTRVLYNDAGVVGEYTISGTGDIAMTNSPVFTTPNIGLANTNDGIKFGTNTGPVFYSDSGFSTPLGSLNFSSDGVFNLDSGTGGHNARFSFTGVTGTQTYTLPDATGTVALTSDIPSLTGYVNTTGTPANNQIAIFTDADTVEGDSSLTYDGTSFNLATAKNFQIAGTTILADATGTTTLSNIDAIDATTESTIEAAIDTLANLTSIQGRTVTLADAGADAFLIWDDSASAYQNSSQADARIILGLGTAAYVATDLADLRESTIEAAIDTLANLTSIQGQTISLSAPFTLPADPNADRIIFWDDSAGATAYLAVGNSIAITTTTIDTIQDIRTSATPSFTGANLSAGTATLGTVAGAIDAGGATSLEVPNGAGGTTVNAAGEVCVDTTSDTLNFYDGTLEAVLTPIMSKAITIPSPTAAEDISLFYSDEAITITKIVFVITGSTSVTTTIRQGTDRSAAGTEVVTGGTVANSTTTGNVVTSFNDATVPADSFLWLETSSLSGTPTSLSCTIFYRQDA